MTNVTNVGAIVGIGIVSGRPGSHLFIVKTSLWKIHDTVVKAGDIVKVKVLEVDL
ncbi:hypothetical protein ACNKHU_21065 [Shigella flexneri]